MYLGDFRFLTFMMVFPLFYWLPKSLINLIIYSILKKKVVIEKLKIVLKPYSPVIMLFCTMLAWSGFAESEKQSFILYFVFSLIALIVNLSIFIIYCIKKKWCNVERWLKIIIIIHIIFDIAFSGYAFYEMANYVEHPHTIDLFK